MAKKNCVHLLGYVDRSLKNMKEDYFLPLKLEKTKTNLFIQL
jgi:hypothetical protein